MSQILATMRKNGRSCRLCLKTANAYHKLTPKEKYMRFHIIHSTHIENIFFYFTNLNMRTSALHNCLLSIQVYQRAVMQRLSETECPIRHSHSLPFADNPKSNQSAELV